MELLEKGDAGSKVEQLQEDLMKAGEQLPRYGADGDYGSETVEAVKAFQSRHGLKVDGIAGPNTLDKLEEALTEMAEQKPNDSHKEAWEWAQEKGYFNGSNPRKSITREQFATVLKRYDDDTK
ncbi:peptidoglycan-binding domain-containing protein [Salibacterium salarium]|nr:peptidoglycan-binding domain-containing protein [Salibacterium salarium]